MTIHVAPVTPPSAAPSRTALAIGWPLLHLLRKIIPGQADATSRNSPPTHRPFDRAPDTIDTIDRYACGARVWAYIGGAWLTATVAATSGSSAMVTYPAPGCADTMVETVHATHLQLRDQPTQDHRPDEATPASGPPGAPQRPDAGQARMILGVHRPDRHGICTACVDLAHFSWPPCPHARQAVAVPGTAPGTQFGAP